MVNEEVLNTIELHRQNATGWKLSGAGGGGCVIAVVQSLSDETEKQLMDAIGPLGFDLFSVELDVKGAIKCKG